MKGMDCAIEREFQNEKDNEHEDQIYKTCLRKDL